MVAKQFKFLLFHQQHYLLVVHFLDTRYTMVCILFIHLSWSTLHWCHVKERSVAALFTVGARSEKSEPIFESVQVVVPPTIDIKYQYLCRRFHQQSNSVRF